MWSPTTLAGLLTNPTYTGKAAWYRTMEVTPPGGGRPRRRPRPREDWVEVAMPAIVSEETFAAAQAARASHAAFSPRRATSGHWLLRRLVVCGACGIHARTMQTTSQGRVNRYYLCAYRDPVLAGGPDRVCKQRQIRADELDRFVWEKVRDVLLRPEVLLAGEAASAGGHTPNDELLGTELQHLAARLEQADVERRRLADLYQAGIIDVMELKRRGAEVTARKASLEAEQTALTNRHRELATHN